MVDGEWEVATMEELLYILQDKAQKIQGCPA